MQKITILIPVFNEINTLDKILEKVANTDFADWKKKLF